MPALVGPCFQKWTSENLPPILCSLSQWTSIPLRSEELFSVKIAAYLGNSISQTLCFFSHEKCYSWVLVHDRESYSSKPSGLGENLCPFPPSFFLSLLIVLYWLSACENSVGVQLNSLGSNLDPNREIQVAFMFGLSIYSNVLFPNAQPRRSHSVPASLWVMARRQEGRCVCGWYSVSL